jgi:nucleotidyltransferase/DNA polymerase involved in DNA repair
MLSVSNKGTYRYFWNQESFKNGYLDGLCSFAFLVSPYEPKSVFVPSTYSAWLDVSAKINEALTEFRQNEKASIEEVIAKQERLKAGRYSKTGAGSS